MSDAKGEAGKTSKASSLHDQKEGSSFTVEMYQRRDNLWSFRINGEESLYYSSRPEGVQRTVNAILNGPKEGGISLNVVKAGKFVPAESLTGNEWMKESTVEGRVKLFMTRGKLKDKDSSSNKG